MKKIKIVADSSANIVDLNDFPFALAPLKIITADREFTDNADLNVDEMVRWFDSYKGKSKTSCPNPDDWLVAFGDADEIYCITITSGLSGSYNSACIAKQMYKKNSDKRVYVIDSLSAGPELVLIIEKLQEYISQNLAFDEICEKIEEYKKNTGLVFILESLKNFAANGRVSPAIAKIAGVLGIRIVGKASDKGTLEPTDKCRGASKSITALLKNLDASGLSCGKVRIAHCCNKDGADELKRLILEKHPQVDISVRDCLGLCSYYAEKGGMLVGFEKF